MHATLSVLRAILGALVLALALLPIANWIPGGHAAPWYRTVAEGWITGAMIVLGGGAVLAIVSRSRPAVWTDRLFAGPIERWQRSPVTMTLATVLAAFVLYVSIAIVVFGARPLHIDEISQLLHAEIYTSGALWAPAPPRPEFFSSMHMIDDGGRLYSHFPAGGPALLALGVLAGAAWLVIPVSGAVATYAFIAILHRVEPRPGVALGAALLFAFAPFMMFMSGTYMNHVPALMLILIGAACLVRVAGSPIALPSTAFWSGVAFGAASTIRPLDAFAFALPAGIWYLALVWGDRRRWIDALAAGAGVAIPFAVLMFVNWRTTGAPLHFGYEVLWGKNFGPGFHASPWGDPHTPLRGLELVNLYLLRLGTYLYETPLPAVLPAIGALLLTRRWSTFDRYLLGSSTLLLGLYFSYWHDGFHLGPRFMIPLVPVLALWTARFLPALRDRIDSGMGFRTAVYGSVIAVAMALLIQIPSRASQYASGLATLRWNADASAAAADVEGALVLVRESWGSQLIARLWALGISRTEADRFYRYVDTCGLEHMVLDLEAGGTRGPEARIALASLMRDSARVVPSTISPDKTERVLPGSSYSRLCGQRISEDREGFTSLVPLLVARGGGNIYARDLHERDTLLLREYPNRAVYLLRPPSAAEGTPPRFIPLSRDSLWRAWAGRPDDGAVTDRP